MLRLARSVVIILAVGTSTAPAQESYPAKPIKLVVPYPAGGASDILSRVFAEEMAKKLGQPFVIENRPGATGRIGSEAVMRAAPDGYTLLTGVISSHAIAPALSDHYAFDPLKDFVPVIRLMSSPVTMFARKGLPMNNVGELIAFATANPGKISFGSTGPGSITHLAGEMLKQKAKIDMTHVPYRGDAPALNDLIAEVLDVYFAPVGGPIAQSGRVKLMGIASATRSALTPEWPTLSETGAPGFVLQSWTGIFAPAGTPAAIVKRLNETGNEVLAIPKVRQRLFDMSFEVGGGSADEFSSDIKMDLDRFRQLKEVLSTDSK